MSPRLGTCSASPNKRRAGRSPDPRKPYHSCPGQRDGNLPRCSGESDLSRATTQDQGYRSPKTTKSQRWHGPHPPPAPARDGPSSCLHAVSDQELRPLPQVGLAESRTADPSIMIPCPASAPPKCPEPRAFCPGALLSCHCCPVGPGSGPLPCPLLPGCAGRRTRVCSPVKYPGAALVRLGNVVLRQES